MINIIVAAADNGAIGKDGKLLWRLPEDMSRFKNLTTGNIVVMGANTFKEIKRPLPDRINIVVSSTTLPREDLTVCKSPDSAIALASRFPDKEIFICGGQRLYEYFIDIADRVYLTRVRGNYQADAFFPALPPHFALQSCERVCDNGFETEFCTYVAAKD